MCYFQAIQYFINWIVLFFLINEELETDWGKFHRHSVIRCMDMAMIQQRKVEKNIHTYINFIIDKHDQEIEACDEL
ncbi:lipopolysaccharide core biosynthesis protein RfaY [Trichinella spiralis]|uniref:lipopolysaccharide core biosynthesis protein RfaY n=1 Tax=Trichinella spiralis TaxID=6334 RepID=UPI0001EFB813|nr:lipopolysaccharide core biosynthesis protein RfaY [Trichinella spiralis]